MSMQYGVTELRDKDDPSRVQTVFGYVDEETGEFIPDLGRTKQEFAKDADINHIVRAITRSGASEWLDNHQKWLESAVDVEVPNIDYKQLMDLLTDSAERFEELPSAVRKGFDNDPAVFMNFVQSEGGDIELGELIARALPVAVKAGSVAEASKGSEPESIPESSGE